VIRATGFIVAGVEFVISIILIIDSVATIPFKIIVAKMLTRAITIRIIAVA